MDPLSVLGLVANIVQLVDAAINAFTLCRQVYTLGASIEDTQMTYTSNQLITCYSSLQYSLKNPSTAGSQVRGEDADLNDLATQCCNIAELLHEELESLRKTPGGGIRKTSVKLFLKKKKSKRIDKLKDRLDEQGLGTLASQYKGYNAELEQQLSQISANLASCHISISKQLKVEVDGAITANEEQHVLTRQHAETTIAAAVHELNISQDQHRSAERRERIDQQKHVSFLRSLTFDEINLRKNEVSESHPKTFEWIFDDVIKRSWDSLSTWLISGEGIYWINGKAGSGKSTLMKFLATNHQTAHLLAMNFPDSKALIVPYYFWLSGTLLQRSLKGFLCSVLYQLLLHDERLLEKSISHDERALEKRTIHDWSEAELDQLLRLVIGFLTGPVCLFIDGVDEFDQQNDADKLLGLVEDISRASKVKICVSSRPENYLVMWLSDCKQLRLQDLTATDMEICIRDELERVRRICRLASLDETSLQSVVERMILKADGVFLWVYYTLSSLLRGLKNEDNYSDLLDRIENLPSGMQQLYLQMWNRLNGDEERYREEAATYFSYVLDYSLSLFEMQVALDKPLQERYLDGFTPQNPSEIARECERLEIKIKTRCAGLLEMVIVGDSDSRSERVTVEGSGGDTNKAISIESSSSNERDQDTHDFVPTDETTKEVLQQTWANGNSGTSFPSVERRSSVNPQPAGKLLDGNPLKIYHQTKFKFLHRTARDFLLKTKEGQELFGKPATSSDSRLQNVTKARMANLIQGLEELSHTWLYYTFQPTTDIGLHDSEYEIELVLTIKRLCEHLNVGASHEDGIEYRTFWDGDDFEGLAAYCECARYIRHFVENKEPPVTPYYLGFLARCAAEGSCAHHTPENLSLIYWLALQGADLHTKQFDGISVCDPASEISRCLLENYLPWDERRAKIVIETTNLLLPMMVKPKARCLVHITRDYGWKMHRLSISPFIGGFTDLLVHMSPATVYRHGMRTVAEYDQSEYPWTRSPVSQYVPPAEDLTQVVFYTDPDAKKGYGIKQTGWRPNDVDSVYLGQALENSLALDQDSLHATRDDMVPELKRRMAEVSFRSRKSTVEEWQLSAGWRFEYGPSIYTLDPNEDVDESNWIEKGHFRIPRFSSWEDYEEQELGWRKSSGRL